MRDLSTSEKFWYVVKDVLTSPLSMAIWAAGGVASYWLSSIIPLGLAAIAQVGLIYNNLNNEGRLRRLFEERQEREQALSDQQIETLLEQMDFETRQRIRYIAQLQKEIVREARGEDVEDYARKDLDRIVGNLNPLVQRAVRLAMRKQQLTKYLHNVDERALKNYANTLKQRIESTTDPVSKSQYEQALRAREAELQTYQAIAQAAGRIDSQLENVEATFASWKAKVIRIKTADVASAASVSQGLYQELELLTSDIDVLDKSVSQALASDEEIALQQNIQQNSQ
jgi:hypothetical protein